MWFLTTDPFIHELPSSSLTSRWAPGNSSDVVASFFRNLNFCDLIFKRITKGDDLLHHYWRRCQTYKLMDSLHNQSVLWFQLKQNFRSHHPRSDSHRSRSVRNRDRLPLLTRNGHCFDDREIDRETNCPISCCRHCF